MAIVYSQRLASQNWMKSKGIQTFSSIYSVLFNCVFPIEEIKWHTNIIWIYLYRQHCTLDFGSYTKDLSAICADLSSVFILDNSPGAYRSYPGKTKKKSVYKQTNNVICLKNCLKNCSVLVWGKIVIKKIRYHVF